MVRAARSSASRARQGLIVAALLLAGALAPAAAEAQVDGRAVLTLEALDRGVTEGAELLRPRQKVARTVRFSGRWRFSPADDPAFAAPSFDDRAWRVVRPYLQDLGVGSDGSWDGRGWFRLHLAVAPELQGRPLGLAIHHLGDVEVWVDGRRLTSTLAPDGEASAPVAAPGDASMEILPAPVPLVLDGPEHVIAVRYVNPRIRETSQMLTAPLMVLFIGELQPFVRELVRVTAELVTVHRFFIGAALSFALLHFFLFFFNRDSRENLYFALTTVSVAAIVHGTMSVQLTTSIQSAAAMFELFKLGVIGTVISTLLAMYATFYEAPPRRRWVFVGSALVMAAISPFVGIVPIYVYALVPMVETFHVIVHAVLIRSRGARLVAAGFTLFLVASALQILPELGVGTHFVENVYLYGFVGSLASMSTHFARELARARRDLSAQLLQVKELSAISLEQARRAKEDEVARRVLEADNARKQKELEEAKKLEAALAELEAANRDIHAKQAQLIQSEKMASLGMLVAGVAHEINTPVGAISSMHDTSTRALAKLKVLLEERLGAGYTGDQRLQALLRALDEANRVIESGSSRVAGIVQRLRSFARLDEAELKTIDVKDGIEDTLLLLHHELKHGITVTRRYGEVPPIACYPSQLNQVLLNVLVNARQAIGARPGSITVETAVVDGRVHVSIADDGPGIPPEILPRIFDPGFTTKGAGVGTGLGLAICYQIMQAHGGEIRVASERGRGTQFTLVLPMDLREPEGARAG